MSLTKPVVAPTLPANVLPEVVTPEIPKWRFDKTDRIDIDDVAHVWLELHGNTHVMVLADQPHVHVSYTDEQIHRLRNERKFKVTRFYYLKSKAVLANKSVKSMNDLSGEEIRELFMRKSICDGIIRLQQGGQTSRSDVKLLETIAQLFAEWLKTDIASVTKDGRSGSKYHVKSLIPPSPSTARRWLRAYEACDLDIMALAKNYGRSGNRQRKVGKDVAKLVDKFARKYMSRLQPSKASLYLDLKAQIEKVNEERAAGSKDGSPVRLLRCPSRRTFERAIDRLDEYQVLAGRHGPEYAKRKLYIVQKGVDAVRPLERVEMDEWRVPLHTILKNAKVWSRLSEDAKSEAKKVRLWLSTAIDTVTRVCLAARLIFVPTGATAVQTAAMAVHDKSDIAKSAGCTMPWDMSGTYECVTTDTGSSWLHYEFRSANVDLGATLMLAPAGSPQMRGRQERFYRTLHEMLVQRFSGRTFGDVVKKGDYDSEKQATIDYEEFGRAIVRFIVDVYHVTPHAGLGGATPYDTWMKARETFRVLPPPDQDRSRHIFGVTVQRRIGNRGVRVLGLQYQSRELQRLRMKKLNEPVLVRMDPANIGYVSVRGKDGWFNVKCQRPGFDGVTMVHWLLASEKIRGENQRMAKLHEHVVHAALRDIRRLSEKAVRRAGIAAPVISHYDIDRFDRELFRAFDFDDDADVLAILEQIPEIDVATAERDEVNEPITADLDDYPVESETNEDDPAVPELGIEDDTYDVED